MRTEINHMREALASYIEATYHLSDPKVVALRRTLLTGEGIAQTPYIESTPSYEGKRRYEELALPTGVGGVFDGARRQKRSPVVQPAL